MAHPQRYDEADPLLAQVRERALALPGAQEKVSHGHPVFFTGKVFAVFGGVVKGDHDADTYAQSVLVLPDPDERLALLEDDRCFLPAYYGPASWVGLNLRTPTVDWVEVGELLEMSYRNTAPRRLVAELDA
jgi:predicted DNA-binding protein (MmcQ/YjbR family)